MQNLKTELKAVSAALNSLAENVEVLVKALDSPEKKTVTKKTVTKKTVAKPTIEKQPTKSAQIKPKKTKSAPPKKAPAKRKAVSRSKHKKTDTDRVVGIIKRAKRGVDIDELRRKTQFDNKKISNIVHRASQANKIKKIGRGVYGIVEA